jgi:integrase/recombinase XerD
MIEDMTVRNFVAKTQADYIRRIRNFAIYLGRSPDTATREDVRYLQLASSGMGAGTVNGTGSALRFLFDITLDRPDIVRHLPVAREPRKAPVILSPEEVARTGSRSMYLRIRCGTALPPISWSRTSMFA